MRNALSQLLRRIGLRSRTSIEVPALSTEGKVAVLVDQLRQLGVSLFIEEINVQYLKTRSMAGRPEYAKALAMSESNLREMERKREWYAEKLQGLLEEVNARR